MREARLIFMSSATGYAYLGTILEKFGGATTFNSFGWWKGTKESILVIDIVYEPSPDNDAKLYDIANSYRQSDKQESVYLRYGNGHVQFVTEKSCMDNGENDSFDWEKLRIDIHKAPDDETDIVEHAEHVAI